MRLLANLSSVHVTLWARGGAPEQCLSGGYGALPCPTALVHSGGNALNAFSHPPPPDLVDRTKLATFKHAIPQLGDTTIFKEKGGCSFDL
ncbi:hypothetical protein SKAU_G00090390 [Synaphobranchus kaupii]|uniref:Uncharacterized protein n=1 Tax=Synaphobranchus kaupii TaxID=118154 RepID=A0A9Q1FWJ7_SYNKA|nr:hypothetical protein SKAU_G00090390 [Synaphobranchus kaupii]